ncbi:AAA family ATPase [Microbacterium foliorum]|uniref:AAA family ATPase n=1 Tax=Microbacterium foliorum TaxID=104336 RepID=UPI0028D6FC5C|nr:AAA family ATPase [Microbacterium foliorum]
MTSRMLAADDPLPFRPERVLIAGVTGSGKTTLAGRLSTLWNIDRHEMDALHHGANWTPRATFIDDVRAFAAEDRWVTEWQYTSKGTDEILTPRAQLVVWLDYPWPIVRARLLRRTLRRSILRTEMYNGNVEKPIWQVLSTRDPARSILAWQTKTRRFWATQMPLKRERFPHLTIVRLRHPRETERWLRAHAALRLAARPLSEERSAETKGAQDPEGVSIAPPKRRSRDR